VQKNIRTAQMFIFAIIFTLAIVGAASAADNSSGNLTATSVDQASQTHDNSQTVTNSSILNNSQTSNNQTKTNNNQSIKSTDQNTTSSDPQIYNGGVPVSRGIYPAGYSFTNIQDAINAAQAGDTIMLENGATFSGIGNIEITINENLNFDVLNGGTATIDGLLTNWGFYINPGNTVNFNNIIFKNFVKNSFGAAIANEGVLSVTRCTFTGNSAPYSGAIGNTGTGTCTVTDCTFTSNSATNNGGAIANDGTLTVSGSTFTSNTAGSNGGAIASDGTLNINQCTFTGNNAASGGAISNLVIGNAIGTATIHFSRIVDNIAVNGNDIYNSIGGTVDAINNWWGHNTAPTQGIGNEIYGTVTYNPWLVLGITATPYSIYDQHTSTVTADLNHNYNEITQTFTDVSGLGHVIDGIPITFTFTGTPLGTLSTNPANTLNGIATTVFTANTMGTSHVNAGLDSATVHTASNGAQTPADITINNNAVLTITKDADHVNYNVGETVYYTIHVTNNGPDAATNVVVTDTVPAGLTFGTATNGGTYNTGVITWNLASLAANGQFNPSFTATVNSDQQGQDITNTASTHSDQCPTDVTSQPVTIYICNAELSVTKTADKTNYNVGDTVLYTINVTNTGTDTGTNLVVTDTLPAGLTFGTATNGGTYNAETRVITWNLASLPVNGLFSPSFTATVNQGTQGQNIPNSANAYNDQNPTIISSQPVIIHINNAVLTITKTADKVNYNVGETVIYNIDVLNNGPDTATNVVVTDTLPAGLTFGTATNGGSYNAGVITWSLASLAQGIHFNPSFTATVNTGTQGQTITNIAITNDTQNPTPVISPPINIYISNAVLTIKKTATQAVYNVGDTAIYNIDVLNNGPDTATNVVVTDTVPTGLTYISSTLGGIYDSASRTITWTLASLQSGVHFIATVDATVTPEAAGNHLVNTAQAKNDQIIIPVKTTTTIYVPSSALEITKTVNNKTPLVNNNVIYTLKVQNHGPDTANSVKVSDVFTTGGLKFEGIDSINFGTYNPNTGIWTIGNLPANSIAKLVLSYKVERAGTYTNLAKVTSITFDPNLYPTEATVTIIAKEPTTPTNPVVQGKTIAMQHTGLPIGALILAVIMLFTGIVLPKMKN